MMNWEIAVSQYSLFKPVLFMIHRTYSSMNYTVNNNGSRYLRYEWLSLQIANNWITIINITLGIFWKLIIAYLYKCTLT